MAIIDSLVAKLSFDFDSKALTDFNRGMATASKAIAAVAIGAAGAGTAIFAFTSKIAEQNDELGKTAQVIGITSQAIAELGFVSELNGGSVNSMTTSLENLAKTSSEAARGLGAGVEAFGLLGVSTTDTNGKLKNADVLLLDVADSIAQLDSQSQKLELLNKLGIDSALLLTLEQGSAAIRAQRKEVEALGFVLDKDATTSAANFNDEMLRVGTVVQGVSSAIGTKLMKQITPMVKVFLEWFKANKEIIKQNLNVFFEKLVGVITAIFNIGVRVVKVVNSIVDAFGGWKVAIIGVSAAILALNARILIIPVLFALVGAAIFLLIEDFTKFANGGESQLGQLAKKSDTFRIALEGIIGVLSMIGKGWVLIFTQGDDALQGLIISLERLSQMVLDLPAIKQIIEIGNNLNGFGDAGVLTRDQVTHFSRPTAPGVSSSNTITNNNVINIDGGNPQEVKRIVQEAMGADLKLAEQNVGTQQEF